MEHAQRKLYFNILAFSELLFSSYPYKESVPYIEDVLHFASFIFNGIYVNLHCIHEYNTMYKHYYDLFEISCKNLPGPYIYIYKF